MKTIEHDAKPAANWKHRQWLFPAGVIVVYLTIYFVVPDRTVNALMASGNVLKQMALPLLLAFVMMVVLNLFITPTHVSRFLGSRAVKPVLLPLIIGYFGWRFALVFTVLNMAGALLVAAVVIYLCDGRRNSRQNYSVSAYFGIMPPTRGSCLPEASAIGRKR